MQLSSLADWSVTKFIIFTYDLFGALGYIWSNSIGQFKVNFFYPDLQFWAH